MDMPRYVTPLYPVFFSALYAGNAHLGQCCPQVGYVAMSKAILTVSALRDGVESTNQECPSAEYGYRGAGSGCGRW